MKIQKEHTQENKLFHIPKYEQKFSHYFDSQLVNGKEVNKSSRATSCSQYMATLEQYAKNKSYIDSISTTFDNGKISDLYESSQHLVYPSNAFLALPAKIQSHLTTINSFFNPKMIGKADIQQIQPLYLQNYVSYLSILTVPLDQFTKEHQIMIIQTKESQIFKELQKDAIEINPSSLKSKIELLLAEIYFQKKRKENCQPYIQAMEIKLDQFINYVLEDDDRYLGLSLKDKLSEIAANLDQYRGKVLNGWLKIVLIEIFFQQFKQLQFFKLSLLKEKKNQKLQCEVYSQIDKISIKSHSNKGQYSEPNSKRNRQDQWIGRIK